MGFSKSIIFYTGNKKSPKFSAKIVETLKAHAGNLPIVSVSQQPMDLGRNICVGDVGASYLNVYRQILIGARAADTDYLIFAEDDFLYPPEYFAFEPAGADFYRHDNTWMVLRRGWYYRTKPIGGAQVCKRKWVIEQLEQYLDGCPEWVDGDYRIKKPDWNGKFFKLFSAPPVVAFKTDGNLSKSGSTIKQTVRWLPLWGDVAKLRREYDVR